jgi:hypothetical protein
MSRRSAALLLIVGLVGVGGWALAQPGAPAPPRAPAEAGRFAVSTSTNKSILLDAATGKTWLLHESAEGHRAAWLPIDRIDDPQEAAKWRAEQEELRREQEERRRRSEPRPREAPRGAGAAAPRPEQAAEEFYVLRLKNAPASEVATTLEQLCADKGGAGARFVSDVRTNTLLVRGSEKQFEQVKRLVDELDVPAERGRGGPRNP